jgi:hypothetical protein
VNIPSVKIRKQGKGEMYHHRFFPVPPAIHVPDLDRSFVPLGVDHAWAPARI